MIQLEGLSPMQMHLARRIWEIDDDQQLIEFVKGLPRSVAQQAYVVMDLMLLAGIEQEDLGDMTEARELLARIR